MANVRIADLPAATLADIRMNTLVEIETPGGQSKKATIQQILESMGIVVNELANLTATGDNRLAFVTNGRKVGESAGNGTGVLAMGVDGAAWDRVTDDSPVVV